MSEEGMRLMREELTAAYAEPRKAGKTIILDSASSIEKLGYHCRMPNFLGNASGGSKNVRDGSAFQYNS